MHKKLLVPISLSVLMLFGCGDKNEQSTNSQNLNPITEKEQPEKNGGTNTAIDFNDFDKSIYAADLTTYFYSGLASDNLVSLSKAFFDLDLKHQEMLLEEKDKVANTVVVDLFKKLKETGESEETFIQLGRTLINLNPDNNKNLSDALSTLKTFPKEYGKSVENSFNIYADKVIATTKPTPPEIKPLSDNFISLHNNYLNALFLGVLYSYTFSNFNTDVDSHYDKSEEFEYYYQEYLNQFEDNLDVQTFIHEYYLAY